jgi:hypothetical protein
VLLSAQVRSRHRRLALGEELDKDLSESSNGRLQIVDVHGRSAVHHVTEATQVILLQLHGIEQ